MRKRLPWVMEDLSSHALRVAVIGGWIVYQYMVTEHECSLTSTFVPDKEHDWEIIPEERSLPDAEKVKMAQVEPSEFTAYGPTL
jgi:hypothetical protein